MKNISFINENLNINHSLSDMASSPVNFEMHIHDTYELYYFLKGDVTYYIEGHGYNTRAGDLLIINNSELHKPFFNSTKKYERITIHFNPWYYSRYSTHRYNILSCFEVRQPGKSNKITKDDIKKHKVDKYYQRIINYAADNNKEAEIMIETLFVQLLVIINKIYESNRGVPVQQTDHDEKVLNIINYINDNLNKKISLKLLSEKFYLDKYYIAHLFKENTGFSVQQYIIYKKIIKAKELLFHEHSCSDVCNILNFGDYSNFYKAFKKNVGISPQEYQKKNT